MDSPSTSSAGSTSSTGSTGSTGSASTSSATDSASTAGSSAGASKAAPVDLSNITATLKDVKVIPVDQHQSVVALLREAMDALEKQIQFAAVADAHALVRKAHELIAAL